MIRESDFILENDKREALPLDNDGFDYICNHTVLKNSLHPGFSWHWHPALEIDCVIDGEITFKTTKGTYKVKKGEAFFINSNVMHDIHLSETSAECEIYAHIFSPGFLSGARHGELEQKYVAPILRNTEFEAFVIRPDHYETVVMSEKLINMINISRGESFGYEFKIRAELSEFWCLLLKETYELRKEQAEFNTTDTDRLKLMIKFIHENYMEKLTLEQIASSANISVRECARCFKRCIADSPINYLNEHRIRMAAEKLMYSKDNIMTISENCGFSSASYMGKVFVATYGCTPKEFRNKKINNNGN